MNKRTLFAALAVLSIIAAVAMYVIGGNSSHLTELRDFWWVPLPITLISVLALAFGKKAS